MKYFIILWVCTLTLLSCQGGKATEETTVEEKAELEKVETFKKTDKEREDSVLAKWQNKMEESKVGE